MDTITLRTKPQYFQREHGVRAKREAIDERVFTVIAHCEYSVGHEPPRFSAKRMSFIAAPRKNPMTGEGDYAGGVFTHLDNSQEQLHQTFS